MPRELPVTSATLPVKSNGSFMNAVLVENSGPQSTRTASQSTKYEYQRPASRSPVGVETLGTPLAKLTSTSQCKRRCRTTHRTRPDEGSGIRFSGWRDKRRLDRQSTRL